MAFIQLSKPACLKKTFFFFFKKSLENKTAKKTCKNEVFQKKNQLKIAF